MDTDLREQLQAAADRIPVPAEMPEPTRRRVHQRRTINAALTGALVLATVAAAVVGSFAARDALSHRSITPGGSTAGSWKGIWPETTRSAAEAAQAKVDAGSQDLQWRLNPGATAQAYAKYVLGWVGVPPDLKPDQIGPDAVRGPLTVSIHHCLPATSAAVQGACGQVVVTLERLVRLDGTGIWSVVAVRISGGPGSLSASPSLSPEAVLSFVDKFLTFRVKDVPGASDFLSPQAMAQYRSHQGGLYLFSPTSGGHYIGFLIESVQASGSGYSVKVRIDRNNPNPSFTEELVVGLGPRSMAGGPQYIIQSASRLP